MLLKLEALFVDRKTREKVERSTAWKGEDVENNRITL